MQMIGPVWLAADAECVCRVLLGFLILVGGGKYVDRLGRMACLVGWAEDGVLPDWVFFLAAGRIRSTGTN